MMLLFIPLMLFTSFLFTRMMHPLSMGVVLLIQTCLVCISSGLLSVSYWFSYILFLVFLGGMLVLFIYVASLASNEPFRASMISIGVLSFFLFISLFFIVYDTMSTSLVINFQVSDLVEWFNDYFLVKSIYGESVMIFTLFIVLYLLLTLFVVVEITSSYFGPLRFKG